MKKSISLDEFILKIQSWIRSKPLLYRLTLGIRILLAIGFIPTGIVKLLGYRFTSLSLESDTGAFFESLYQTGLYWQFLGLSQVVGGLLLLIPSLSALGALIFSAIIVNIVVITISLDFAYTPVITIQMLLATLWLLLWDYHRFRSLLFGVNPNQKAPSISNHKLADSFERSIYIVGASSGLLLFGILRGLTLPAGSEFVLVGLCFLCFASALILGIRHRTL